MLVETARGLNFVREDYWGEETSPIFMAMRYSGSLSSSRQALHDLGINIRELLRVEVETNADGWTLERLSSLWLDETKAEGTNCNSRGRCRVCEERLSYPDWNELAWKRRVNRFKYGVDLDAPLGEEEASEQKALDDAIVDYNNDVCLWCHKKKKKSMSSWSILG